MGCGPSFADKGPNPQDWRNERSVTLLAHPSSVQPSQPDIGGIVQRNPRRPQRLLRTRQLLILHTTLENELRRVPTQEADRLVQQMRVDEILARMIFEEQSTQFEMLLRSGGSAWPNESLIPQKPKLFGVTEQELEDVTCRKVHFNLEGAPAEDEATDCSECVMCLEQYEDGVELRVLGCGHTFHLLCVDEWLHRSRVCPLCNQEVGAEPSKRSRTINSVSGTMEQCGRFSEGAEDESSFVTEDANSIAEVGKRTETPKQPNQVQHQDTDGSTVGSEGPDAVSPIIRTQSSQSPSVERKVLHSHCFDDMELPSRIDSTTGSNNDFLMLSAMDSPILPGEVRESEIRGDSVSPTECLSVTPTPIQQADSDHWSLQEQTHVGIGTAGRPSSSDWVPCDVPPESQCE